jgi:uncharacterized protein YjbI with pentapeptide repeats
VAVFVCGVREKNPNYRSACKYLPEYRDTGYCVLHFPREKKKENFEQVKQSKLEQEDYDFSGTVFPEGTSDFAGRIFNAYANFNEAPFFGNANFSDAKFSGERTYFRNAKFSGEWTDFSGAQFSGEITIFSGAQFSGKVTDFSRARFSSRKIADFRDSQFSTETTFQNVTFEGRAYFLKSTFERKAYFGGATFEEVSFEDVTFVEDAGFDRTTFKREAYFRGLETFSRVADFQFTRIEKPDLFSFHRVKLRPSWFINVDPRKFDFTDVQWPGQPGGPKVSLDDEIRSLQDRKIEAFYDPYILLAQACRRLSANAEENREYPLANEFHYWSMDALRKRSWLRLKGLTPNSLTKIETWRDIREHFGLITTLYWALSGYGVRAARAFWMLVAIWAAFTTLYVLVDPSEFKDFGQGIGYRWQAAVYSLLALARLNPEPRPEEPGLFQFLVGLEGILGPLQIALLALAVRRKVMR